MATNPVPSPEQNPSPTPWTGNPVLTGNTITLIVAIIVYLARTKGYEIDQDGKNLLINFLSQPAVGETIVGLACALMTWVTRSRVYSELSMKLLTGKKRPGVPKA